MWWEILELTAEADQKAIKQAYARKLKQTRPDDDPEGFKVLHDAYKQALAWSSYQDFIDHHDHDDHYEDDERSTKQALQSSENLTEQITEPRTALKLTRLAPPTSLVETEPTSYPLYCKPLNKKPCLSQRKQTQVNWMRPPV